ncbi:MAG: type I 3-dehydroquinate dehydratase [Candidatus Limivivens sp.]|nr:type I 3-dehydroquinate dehydratase [Candidatus Limivivens sp.]
MGKLQVRNLTIGEGRPKICVPIVETTAEGILKAARAVKGHPCDMIEWRADFFEDYHECWKVRKLLEELRLELGDMPLLYTFRTRVEGGNAAVDYDEYLTLNHEAITSGCIDLVDVEILRGDDTTFLVVEEAHQNQVFVVGSNHDFQGTPKKEAIIMRLCRMQELEADIAKMAVMPKTPRDVLTLLDATLAMRELHNETPVVTMAMGRLGLISRMAGELFGSAITFGTVGEASAPGQIPSESLARVLEQLSQIEERS